MLSPTIQESFTVVYDAGIVQCYDGTIPCSEVECESEADETLQVTFRKGSGIDILTGTLPEGTPMPMDASGNLHVTLTSFAELCVTLNASGSTSGSVTFHIRKKKKGSGAWRGSFQEAM
jgi:hypothetical protein